MNGIDLKHEPLLILGTGCAGTELAFSARASGWSGPISLVGDETSLPYHRPPLSKAFLAGQASAESLHIKTPQLYAKFGIELVTGVRATAIDKAGQTVQLADGRQLPYGQLALATGGRVRSLPAAPAAACTNFHYLRTDKDAGAIYRDFGAQRRLVIVGGGYVGLEVAAAAVKCGMRVTVLEAAARLLVRVTAPQLSQFYLDVHRAAGVDVRVGVQVDSFALAPDRQQIVAVHCSDGTSIDADVVVAGIGLLPNTELAGQAALAVDDGIVVDAQMRTTAPRIFAVGDCARFYSGLYERAVRIESVPNALEQARKLAAILCGKQPRADSAPWFWSDQYDLSLKMVGLSQGYDRLVVRGSLDDRSFSAFYLLGQRVLAADTVNRPLEFTQAKRMVNERTRVDERALADESVPLAHLFDQFDRLAQ